MEVVAEGWRCDGIGRSSGYGSGGGDEGVDMVLVVVVVVLKVYLRLCSIRMELDCRDGSGAVVQIVMW